ncbi:hypothetical protein EHQ76_10550 [Leptospira barantonii]|uniref:Lipoprotein n=1 Tax=Leptospira barantonii TaxID=2023184 RepID=A0A5F2B697_9LEPT|nr:hypothetical protein [Leptospira barantonii]TGM01075.1 hypothetical protein EHQ76_10550 [Leptospira barantonii]
MNLKGLNKYLATAILLSLITIGCEDKKENETLPLIGLLFSQGVIGGNGAGNGQGQPPAGSLPQPALDTATFIENGQSHTLNQVNGCRNFFVSLNKSGGNGAPAIALDAIDFSKNSNVLLYSGQLPNLDVNIASGTGYTIEQNKSCPAYLFENSASVYDIQILNCNMVSNGFANLSVSFRIRCAKE